MDSNLMIQKPPKASTLITWALIASAIFSCSSRADYNAIIGFLILFIRSQYMNDKSRFTLLTKATIHILVISLFFDVIWIWEFTSFWRHGSETSDLWKSLSFVHNFTYFLAFLEFFIKFPIVLLLFKQFKASGGKSNELMKINYIPNTI